MCQFFQCTGCPTGPCTIANLDPEFEPGMNCLDKRYEHENIAVWRRLEATE